MRFKSLFIFAASLLAYSQLAQSADVWQGQPSYPVNRQHDYSMPYQVSAGYPQSGKRADRFNAYQNRPFAAPGNYRFRNWDLDRENRAKQQYKQVPVDRPQRAVSYWGGNPVRQLAPAVGRSTSADYTNRPALRRTYQPQRMAYAPAQYRFRPLQKRAPLVSQPRLKYRPMQVEIPQHVRFRPLNPVAQTRLGHNQENRYRHMWPQPNSYAQQQPGYAYPVQSMQRNRYVYNYNYPEARDWRSNYNAWQAPAPQPIVPSPMAMPGYVWRAPAPRFRTQPLPRQMHYPSAYPRHAYNMGPYWGQNRQPGYPAYPQPMPNIYNGYSSRLPMARPQWQAPANRYSGTDWYDGQHDGEGAWYQLASRNQPTVSQHWSDPAGGNLATE